MPRMVSRGMKKRPVAAIVAAVSLAAVAAGQDPRPRVAVAGIRMADGADARDAWMATAIEETLAWRLRRTGTMVIVPTARIYQAQRDAAPRGEKAPELPTIVRLLGAQQVIRGVCTPAPRGAALQLTISDAAGAELAAGNVESTSIAGLLREATSWVLAQYKVETLPENVRKLIEADPCASPSALEYYAKAVIAARQDKLKDVGYYVSEALSYDKHFREAVLMHARLAMHGGPASFREASAKFRLLNEIARHYGDEIDRANAELGHGTLALYAGHDDTALDRFESSLSIIAGQSDPYGQITAMTHIVDTLLSIPAPRDRDESGRAAAVRANVVLAAEWQSILVSMLGEMGDLLAEGPAASKLALILERLERWDEALALHRRSLELIERTGLNSGRGGVWLLIAQHHSKRKMWNEALDAATRGLSLTPAELQAPVRVTLAGIYRAMNLPADALAQYDAVLKHARASESLEDQLACLKEKAGLEFELAKKKEALASIQEAIDVAHVLRSPEEAALKKKLDEWKGKQP